MSRCPTMRGRPWPMPSSMTPTRRSRGGCVPTCCTSSCCATCRRRRRRSSTSVAARRISRCRWPGSVTTSRCSTRRRPCWPRRSGALTDEPADVRGRVRFVEAPGEQADVATERRAVRRRAVPRRADVPRRPGAAGERAVPLRPTGRRGLGHGAERADAGDPAGARTALGRRARCLRRPVARSACSVPTPAATPSRGCRHCCARAASSPRTGTACGCSPTGWNFPVETTDVAAVAEVELQASLRDPYRQLSRVFHLVGRRAG